MSLFVVGCSTNDEEVVVQPTQEEELKLAESITADFGTSSMTITSGSSTSQAKRNQPGSGGDNWGPDGNRDDNGDGTETDKGDTETTTATAYFFVRVDSYIPDEDSEKDAAKITSDYYPQTSIGGTDFEFPSMQRKINLEPLGTAKYLLSKTGISEDVFTEEGTPDMAAVRAAFKDGVITYNGEVIYNTNDNTDELDGYHVVWYVAKVDNKGRYHVDGALVPADQTEVTLPDEEKKEEENSDDTDIEIDLDLDEDLVLKVDDFDIRKSGVDEYVAFEKLVDSNTLEYNGVTITRGSDMKLKISGLNNLDWSAEGTVWTFEAYLWAYYDLISPEDWSYGDTDKSGTIDNALYNIEYHYYQGFQSEGLVPYVKVSVHVTKK